MADFGFNPSIILSNLIPQPREESPQETLRNLSDLATARNQQQLQQASLSDMLYKQGRERSLADLVSQNAGAYTDPLAQAYARGGFGSEAADAQAQSFQRQQQAANLLKIHADLLRSQAATIKTPEQASAFIGRLPPEIRSLYGFPADEKAPGAIDAIKGFIASGISPEKQAELENKRNELNKSRFHFVNDTVRGGFIRGDELTGAYAPIGMGGGVPDGEPHETAAPPGSKLADYKKSVLGPLGEDLDPTKGRSNLAQEVQEQIRAGQRLDQLLNRSGPMTYQKLHEATLMAATIANGGHVPTEAQVEAMFPDTLKGKSAAFWQRVTGVPMDTGTQAFVDLLRQQSEGENALGERQLQEYFLGRLSKHPQAFQDFPEEANRMAEARGLKGLYDPKTLLPVKTKETGGPGVERRKLPDGRILEKGPDGKVRVVNG